MISSFNILRDIANHLEFKHTLNSLKNESTRSGWFPPSVDLSSADESVVVLGSEGLLPLCTTHILHPKAVLLLVEQLEREERYSEAAMVAVDLLQGSILPSSSPLDQRLRLVIDRQQLQIDLPTSFPLPKDMDKGPYFIIDALEKRFVKILPKETLKEYDSLLLLHQNYHPSQIVHVARERVWAASNHFPSTINPAPLSLSLLEAMVSATKSGSGDPALLLGFLNFNQDYELKWDVKEALEELGEAFQCILVNLLPTHLPRWLMFQLNLVIFLNSDSPELMIEASEILHYWGHDSFTTLLHRHLRVRCGPEGKRWGNLLEARRLLFLEEYEDARSQLGALEKEDSSPVWHARQTIVDCHLQIITGSPTNESLSEILEQLESACRALDEPWYYADALALRLRARLTSENTSELLEELAAMREQWPHRLMLWREVCAEASPAAAEALVPVLISVLAENPYPRILWEALANILPDRGLREALCKDLGI